MIISYVYIYIALGPNSEHMFVRDAWVSFCHMHDSMPHTYITGGNEQASLDSMIVTDTVACFMQV